tara:strand:+ start:10471 stop:11724 length:1254 start_codon:yes stop_codon:yes gene_type:complete
MNNKIIKNIKTLLQVRPDNFKGYIEGKSMQELPSLNNAWLAIEGDTIVDYGLMEDWPGISDWRNLEVIDAEGKMVLPTFVDSHTHIVFATSREEEFVGRLKGLTYQEIANQGGGILNSARKLAEMDEETLYQEAYERLDEVMKMGTGAVEIKSGYGLSVEGELKILRVIKRLKETHPLTIKATFLGAHAIPKQYKNNKQGYLDLLVNELLPVIKAEGLAEFVDAFLEDGYFSNEDVSYVLKHALKYGLIPKVHVNQFTATQGVETCINHQALSVDHLEVMDEQDYLALSSSDCIPTILPSCSFFLGIPYAPARKMIENNLPVALASDYNPGSTPSGNMEFVIALACIKNKMLPEEALNAASINSAYSMKLDHKLGSISRGKLANLIITKPIPSIAYMPYCFGQSNIEKVIINGNVVN